MPRTRNRRAKTHSRSEGQQETGPLVWLRARYEFHTFSYRDPRGPFSAAVALPVVSPTAVLLGICSTLYEFGQQREAEAFIRTIHLCAVKIDPPEGAVFFRAFHQLRRYTRQSTKSKGAKPSLRIGLTDIGEGSREYGLFQGPLTLYVRVPERQKLFVAYALRNRDHLGTHDSLCSLIGDIDDVSEPEGVIYDSLEDSSVRITHEGPVAVITLSRFVSAEFGEESLTHWRMAGGPNTQLAAFIIPGRFTGTRAGKIYRKRA